MSKVRSVSLLITLLCSVLALSAAADRLILIPEGTTLTGVKGEFLTRDGDEQAIWASAGISRFEVEGAWFRDFGAENNDAISAQVSVLPETSFTPALALGVRDIGDNTDRANGLYDGRAFYVAASKGIPFSEGVPLLQDLKVHGGLGTGSLSGLFFGAEAGLPGGLQIKGEYDTEDFNFAATYNILPLVKLELASIRSDMYYGASFSTSF